MIYGIDADGALNIYGDAEVTAESLVFGIKAGGIIISDDAVVKATADIIAAIYSASVTIQGNAVVEATATGVESTGIISSPYNMYISGYAEVEANGGMLGISAGSLYIDGNPDDDPVVKAEGGLIGISVAGLEVAIGGGYVEAVGEIVGITSTKITNVVDHWEAETPVYKQESSPGDIKIFGDRTVVVASGTAQDTPDGSVGGALMGSNVIVDESTYRYRTSTQASGEGYTEYNYPSTAFVIDTAHSYVQIATGARTLGDTTVNITTSDSFAIIASKIDNALFYAARGYTVTVTGQANPDVIVDPLVLTIPKGVTLDWQADYSGNAGQALMIVYGGGTLSVSAGGTLMNTYAVADDSYSPITTIMLDDGGGDISVEINGGTVSAVSNDDDGDATAIFGNGKNISITVNSGTVNAEGSFYSAGIVTFPYAPYEPEDPDPEIPNRTTITINGGTVPCKRGFGDAHGRSAETTR
ncbi:hypothetical protein FACS18949_17620 [Clostridia bacterium]|nr:hypothetical protein FACS18949_17620 [Clostridia bacterium]